MTVGTPCNNGEDLEFLAVCAVSRNFDLLETGFILPEHMNPETGAWVAKWLLALKAEDSDQWPPTYRAIKFQWPDLSWPDVPDEAGLDPKLSAFEVLLSYRLYLSAMIHAEIHSLTQLNFGEEYASTAMKVIDRVHELRTLADPKHRILRVGDNPEHVMDTILGQGPLKDLALLRTGVPSLDEMLRPMEPGLIAFFARPKNMKSWLLQYAAIENSILNNYTGVLVDPENNRKTILSRLACALAKIDYVRVRKIQLKLVEGEELLDEEHAILNELEYGVHVLHEMSRLYILGKEDVDPDYGYITTDQILGLAEKVGANVLYIDQLHKIVVPRAAKTNDDDIKRIRKAITFLSDLPDYVIFGATQEKREQDKRANKKFTMPAPKDDWVYGGDAASQNCTFLAHLHAFSLAEDESLLLITPLLGRNTGKKEDPRIFVQANLCTRYEEIPQAEGLAIAQAYLDRASARSSAVRRDASRMNDVIGDAARDSVMSRQKTAGPVRAQLRAVDKAKALGEME